MQFNSIDEIDALINQSNSKLQVGLWNILGVQHSNDWIFSLNIGNVMHLSPMNLDELHSKLEITHELNRDAMLEKVILISVSYFCYATELWFMSTKNPNKEQAEWELEQSEI